VKIPSGQLGRDTWWSLVALGGRVATSSVAFLALTRHLGADGYGVYAGFLGFVGVFTAFSTLGMNDLLLSGAARSPESFGARWGEFLRVAVPATLLLVLTVGIVQPLVLHGRDRWTLVIFAAAEFGAYVTIDGHGKALAGAGRFIDQAAVQVAYGVGRVIVVLAFVVSGSTSLRTLGIGLMALTAVASMGSSALVVARLGRPSKGGRLPITSGLALVGGQASGAISNDIDKTMLLASAAEIDAGRYAAAWRLAEYAFLPVHALLGALYPRFFSAGDRDGVKGTIGLAKRAARPAAVLALLATAGLVAVSPLASWVLGDSFEGTTTIIIALAGLPLLRTGQSVLGDILTGDHRFWARSRITMVGAAINVAANAALIPSYGWKGAVAGTYLAEVSIVVGLWIAVRKISARLDPGEIR